MVDDERGTRSGHHADLARRVEEALESVQDVQAQRDQMDEALARAQQAQRAEIEEAMAKTQQALEVEQQERIAVDAELAASLKDAKSWAEKEAQAREKGDMALSRSIAALREANDEASGRHEELERRVRQRGPAGDGSGSASAEPPLGESGGEERLQALASRLREECLEALNGDMGAMREGIGKVVEALQQERRTRSETLGKLREDCREAIQKEINARIERDTKMREELEAEARMREEAVEVIQLAIEECRQGLETHTHELTVEDSMQDAIPPP